MMMKKTNPITPPPELVQRLSWSPDSWLVQITSAYQAGADQELEACCLLLDDGEHAASYGCHNGPSLRAARRPKPPSLKERIAAAITDGDERTALSLLNEAMPNV
jgi:hypothetical protein